MVGRRGMLVVEAIFSLLPRHVMSVTPVIPDVPAMVFHRIHLLYLA